MHKFANIFYRWVDDQIHAALFQLYCKVVYKLRSCDLLLKLSYSTTVWWQIAFIWNTVYICYEIPLLTKCKTFIISPHWIHLTLPILTIAASSIWFGSPSWWFSAVQWLQHSPIVWEVMEFNSVMDLNFFLCWTCLQHAELSLHFISWLDLLDSLGQIPISLWLLYLWKVLFQIKYILTISDKIYMYNNVWNNKMFLRLW